MTDRAGEVLSCLLCGTPKYFPPSQVAKKKPGRHFCSTRCLARYALAHYPERYARSRVSTEVRAGRLVRPTACSSCHAGCAPQAHHEDYAKPLDVTWLCRGCHDARSRPARLRAAGRRRKHLSPCPCGRKAVNRGLCGACYMREFYDRQHVAECRAPGCTRKEHARGLCNTCCRKPPLLREYGLPKKKRGPKPKA